MEIKANPYVLTSEFDDLHLLDEFQRIIYFKSAIVKISIKHKIYRNKFGDFRKIV